MRITVFLSDEVLGNVEVTIATSIVKWCIPILFSHDGLQCSSLMRYWAMLR